MQYLTLTGTRNDHQRFDATYSNSGRNERKDFKHVASQYESRRDDFVSKTKRGNYFTTANQVYRYQGSRNVEDVGVGSVKAVPRKRLKKIYLPETDNKSVECTNLSTYFRGKQKKTGHYERKKTSSKCVGDAIESTKEILNEKLSPIIKTKNRMEIEYSNKCSSKIDKEMLAERKPISEFKSTSFFRNRFEVLRRGLGKKRDLKNNSVLLSGTATCVSDSPSYSNTKVYSPYDFSIPKCKMNKNPSLGDKEVSECRSVKNMFNFGGTNFNIDKGPSKKKRTDLKIPNYDSNDSKFVNPEKNSGKKFSFFRKKSKNEKVTERPKQGVTAGRCEVKNGMAMKLETKVMKPIQEITDSKPEQVLEDYVDKLRRAWLQKFIFTNNDSKRSVKIRWKNKKCATSSSTILESMDNVFKETGVVFRSQSDTTFTEESAHQTFRKPRVNFLRHVEAWVMPNTMTTSKVPIHREEKEFAYTKHNALLPRNIKLVLHSKNFVKINNISSDCLKINIPKGFFSDSEGRHTFSDEKVYNVVEYETTNSVSANKMIKQRGIKCVQTDYVIDSFEKIKEKLPVHTDVMLRGSEVSQRDIGEIKNATMRNQDEFVDYYESVDRLYEENLQSEKKKCKFADSNSHDYYRQWTRLGIDLFPWHVSDPYVRGSFENLSHSSDYDQGDESKSCPNICDDFQTSVIVSSCTSSCHDLESQKPEEKVSFKFFKKSKKRTKSGSLKEEVRLLPKDSKEVFKSRKVYAKTNKSQWLCPDDKCYSVTSNECKSAQENCSKCKRISYQPDTKGIEKVCEKRVSLSGCLNNTKNNKQSEGVLPFKESPTCVPRTSEKSPPRFPSQQPSGQSLRQSKRQSPCQLSRQSPQRSPCQSRQLKTSLLPTQKCPNTTLESAPSPKCVPKCPNMSPSTSQKSKIPIKSSQRKTPLNAPNSPNCPNKDFSPTCSGSRVPLKTLSPHVCFKCKNPDCCKTSPKKIVKKRSSNSSSCPCMVTSKKSNKITEKKESPNKNKSNSCPTPPLTKISKTPEKSTFPRSKIGGIFLKLKPSQKKSGCSKECLAQGSNSNVVRINSKEKITIRMKCDQPSTDKIRDGYDIKVKDEDGITLYERKQYKIYQPNSCDIFKDSNIRRDSTHSPIQNPAADKVLDKSDLSILNIVELKFNLKFSQGDKTTEINIANDDNTQKDTEDKIQSVKGTSCDVYAFTENDEDNEKYAEDNTPTNDINIRILIKNLKPKVEKKCDIVGNDRDYYRKISEKFQSVSAASSPIQFDQNLEISRDLSVHRANVDLSLNQSKIKPSQAIVSDGLTDNDHCTVSTLSVRKKYDYKQSFSKIKNNNILLESIPSGTDSTSKLAKELQLKLNFGNDIVSSSKTKYRNRAYKKEHLKMVMEETSLLKKNKSKAKIRKLNKTLKSILTSDSETDEIAVASSEVFREMTCASLSRKFLTKLDSMGYYYNVGGCKVNQLYPSKESKINDSFSSKEAIVCEGCLCSTFARKRVCGNVYEGACCRNPQTRREMVNCDLMSEEKTNDNEETSILEPEYFETVQVKTMSRNELTQESKNGLERIFVPREDRLKEFEMKKLNPSTFLGVTNEDEVFVVNTEANRAQSNQINVSKMSKFSGSFGKSQMANYVTSSHILQSYDVKKAVMNIYAKKTVTSHGEHLVATLPKFVMNSVDSTSFTRLNAPNA